TDNVGLIGYADFGSSISNLGLVGGSVTGGRLVGGLVGFSAAGSSITPAYAPGAGPGRESVRGLLGSNGATITQAYATGAVAGRRYVGGLVGITGGSITQAYATGAVTGTGDNVGGLVGSHLSGTITQAYATGAVTGSEDVGGLVGENDSGTITQAYATGAVTGTGDNVGGLVGQNRGTITQAYATGAVTGSAFVGGLVGRNGGTVQNSFWFQPTGGSRNSLNNGIGTGLDEAAMRNPASFAGWDLSSTWNLQNAPRPFLRYWQQSLTATVANVTTTYTGNDFAGTPGISYSVSGFVPETAPVFDYNGGGAPRHAGTYTINACCLSTQQYVATVVPGTLTINPRQITVRANDLARDYGFANPPLTYRITSGSLANGDSFAGSLATNAGLLSQAGSYAITQGSLALSANYTMSFVPGTLTVRPTAMMSNGGFASTLVAWMNENGQMFWMRRGNTQRPISATDMSFGTAFMTELLSSGGLNAQ
ncbi:MAG: GLUG motif-containing protein, partial [Acetobacteraceae bacterium]